MQNFAEQCTDVARSVLSHNLGYVNEDGSVHVTDGETLLGDESAHVAFALGEYYRLTHETNFAGSDLIELTARAITHQVTSASGIIDAVIGANGTDDAHDQKKQSHETEENVHIGNWIGYVALGLLSFGPVKERNPVWERLSENVRERLDALLLRKEELKGEQFACAIAKAVARYSLHLTKKDDTGKLVDRYLEYCESTSTGGFFDGDDGNGLGGNFGIEGLFNFSFIRQALHLHIDGHVMEKKLPSLRTHAERYLRLIPELIREDGTCWVYGSNVGAYAQMYCISMVIQALRDGWVSPEKQSSYINIVLDLFQNFFCHYIDQDQGYMVIRDAERTSSEHQNSIAANFDAVRYLCQWSRLAKKSGIRTEHIRRVSTFTGGNRLVIFNRGMKRESGLFIYRDAKKGINLQLPLMSGNGKANSDYLAFPHCPGVFDWPAGKYLPILQPELTINGERYVPSYYGKKVATGLGSRGAIQLTYEQPDLVTVEEKIREGLAVCKVIWTFSSAKITSEFIYTAKERVRVERIRYMIALSAPHSEYGAGNLALDEGSLGAVVEKDELMLSWREVKEVSGDEGYRTNYGKVHYLQELSREYPLVMQKGQVYRLVMGFNPEVIRI